MRSFVVEPMQHEQPLPRRRRRPHRAADGAKGMNLAIADVEILASALEAFYASGDASGLASLLRALPAPRLARAALLLLHDLDAPPPDGQDPFEAQLQHAQLEYVCSSEAAATSLAENYVGLDAV